MGNNQFTSIAPGAAMLPSLRCEFETQIKSCVDGASQVYPYAI